MLAALKRRVRRYAMRKGDVLPGGFTWPFVITIDVTLVVLSVIAVVQRPVSEWWIGGIAVGLACLPWVIFFIFDIVVFEAFALLLAWSGGVGILLFATSGPVEGDFAPVLLALLVGVVGSVASMRGGLFAAAAAAALVLTAAVTHRVDTPGLYLSFIGIGWLVGYLMRIQQLLLLEQRQAQDKLAEHAAGDERRRIAREVHDVIAHSLSVTLLHVTGARRGLQEDRDIDEAVEALEQAEQLGRQAMADIRRTVGLLDDSVGRAAPEPGVTDISTLVDDFARAGLDVGYEVTGGEERISAAAGLALYRIAQESLANIAKHAPDGRSEMALTVKPLSATLTVTNRLPVSVPAGGTAVAAADGRGMRGMRQRVELLGGVIIAGPVGELWSVRAVIPLDDLGTCPIRGRA